MLANFLKKSKPINVIGLLVFFFICYSVSVFFIVFNNGFTLDKLLESTILLLFFLAVFFFYNFILSKNKLTFDNSYAYYLFTLLIICVLPELLSYQNLILVIIYLLFLRKMYSLRTSKNVLQKLFDSGFWLGVLFILEPLSILFLIIIFIGVYAHQKITIHTLFTPIIGFVSPLFLYFSYLFCLDKTELFTALFNYSFNIDLLFYKSPKYIWLFASIFTVSLFSIVIKSIATIAVNNTFRKSWYLLIANFAIVTLFLLLLPARNGSELVFIIIPVSIIIANGIELIKKALIKNIVLYSFLFGAIFLRFFL